MFISTKKNPVGFRSNRTRQTSFLVEQRTNVMDTNTTEYKGTGQADPSRDSDTWQAAEPDRRYQMEKKLISRLRDGIDMSGRYKFQLKDLSIGYAAGKGLSEQAAREAIEGHFEREMGVSVNRYLEQHRLDRGLEIGRDNGRGGR